MPLPNSPSFSPAQKAGGLFAAIALAVGLIATFEPGNHLGVVYLDTGGVPTVCYGHTGPDVRMGQPTRSDAECTDLLEHDAFEHGVGLQRCQTRPWPAGVLASLVDLTYNAGIKKVCASTAVRLANAGDFKGACAELSRWVYDGKIKLRGLVRRRAAERAICERYENV